MTGKPENLEAKVVGWLERTGLPLELKVRSAFAQRAIKVRHSEPYRDPETNKAREIDVVASVHFEDSRISVHFVVECKASPNPWVVVSSDGHVLHKRSAQDLGLRSSSLAYLEPGLRWKANDLSQIDHVAPGGHILKQAFTENTDPGFTISTSVMKACRSIIEAHPNRTEYVFALPIVVVDAPLFHCSMNSDGRFDIKRCEFAIYRATVHIPQAEESVVRVATRLGLDRLIDHCQKQAAAISAEVARLKAAKWQMGRGDPLDEIDR